MKVMLPKTVIETSETFVEETFSIGDMARILGLLRSNIYSNPIRTIVQEIGSNARDAHREVGKRSTPIHIKLPNKIAPTFEVRDYGPGISPSRMSNVFLKYGVSTKDDSNEQTGGFGLGAKSPFSYSDTFAIESITPEAHFKGQENCLVKRTYIAFIDPSRMGKMSLASAEVTNDPQGVKIIVTCKPGDAEHFKSWTLKTCEHWPAAGDPHPIISGSADFAWPKAEKPPLFADPDGKWTVDEGEGYSYRGNGKVTAIVDGIPYVVEEASMKGLTDKACNLFNKKVNIHFGVGELSLTANREALDYQTPTIDKLKNAFVKVIRSLKVVFEDKIKDCPTYYEASARWNEVKSSFGDIIGKVNWKGIALDGESIHTPLHVRAWTYELDTVENRMSSRKADVISFLNKHIVAWDDSGLCRPSRGKVMALLTRPENVGKHVIVIAWGSDDSIYNSMEKDPKDHRTVKQFKDAHHWEHWGATHVTSLEPLKMTRNKDANAKAGTYRPMVRVRKFDADMPYGGYQQRWSESEQTVEDGEGIYVVLRDKEANIKNAKGIEVGVELAELQSLIKLYDPKITLHGIQSKYAHRIGDGWTEFGVELLDKVREIAPEIKVSGDDADSNTLANHMACEVAKVIEEHVKDADKVMQKWIDDSKAYEPTKGRADQFSLAVRLLEADVKPSGTFNLKETALAASAKFPLLRYMGNYNYGSGATNAKHLRESLIEYLK